MLKSLDPLLGPDLLHALASMGHGDEIAVVDANFPGASCARRLIRLDGIAAPRAVQAVLSVLPLDDFVPTPLSTMAVVGGGDMPEAVAEFRAQVRSAASNATLEPAALEREAFYERARAAYAVVQTGETRLYGNALLRKGVVRSAAEGHQ
jgi:L-fucose mutarotase